MDETEDQDLTDEPVEKYTPEKWKCPNCGAKVTTHVPIKGAPVCNSKTKHTTKSIDMVKAK